LSTGRDIINLWVARMIFSGLEFMEKEPFTTIFIHPTVLNSQGQRMSKSLGTGIDPVILIDKYGADATRFGIMYQMMGNQDLKFKEDASVTGQKFCNKIWNATRFVLMQTENSKFSINNLKKELKLKTSADKKIIKDLEKIIKSINKDLEDFNFGQALHNVYNFFWHDFCDTYIEKSKPQIQNPKSAEDKINTQKILFYVLINSLKILHPFIPFVTEEIYQKLPIKDKKHCIMIESWPK